MNYTSDIHNTVSSHVLIKLLAVNNCIFTLENKTFAHFLVPFRKSDRPLSFFFEYIISVSTNEIVVSAKYPHLF